MGSAFLHHFAEHGPPGLQVGLGLVLAVELLVALEQLEVALGDGEPGLDGQLLVAERLAEGRHQAVGADHHGHLADQFQLARFGQRGLVDVLHA